MLSSLFRVIQFKKNEDNMLNVGDNINESTFIKMGDLKVLINLVEKDKKKTRVFSKDYVANIQFFFSNVDIKWIITQSFFFNKNYI